MWLICFFSQGIRTVNIGAENIVDGEPDLTLGLIWSIILRFHITQIEIQLVRILANQNRI